MCFISIFQVAAEGREEQKWYNLLIHHETIFTMQYTKGNNDYSSHKTVFSENKAQ